MSVLQLPSLDDQRVVEAMDIARAAVRSAAQVRTATLSVDDLTDAIAGVAVLESQLSALRLALLAEADERKVAASLAATGTDAWAAALTGSTRAVMAGGVWLARMLTEKYDATREALADGGINEAQARVIVKAGERLPTGEHGVSEAHRRAAEAGLVAKAVNGMDARRLRQAARRMLDIVTREVAEAEAARLADEHEATMLREEEERAEVETWMTLGDNGDGTFSGRFVVPELHGHLLQAFLDRLTSPHRLSRGRDGEVVHDDSLPGAGPNLSYTERLGLGLTELIEHLPTEVEGGFSRSAVTLLVHVDHQHLLDGLASARLDTGAHLSAGEARRLACSAGILPVVLDGSSQVLDLGRERRLHSTAQRRALSVRHDTCATEGCERPFAWCDVHHPHPWSQGGATDLANAVPLCGFHHRRAHDRRFDPLTLPTGDVRFERRRRGSSAHQRNACT
jgi:hypothetical protein